MHSKTLFSAVTAALMFTSFISTLSYAGSNAVLGQFPSVCKKYVTEMADLYTQYRKAKTDEEKNSFKAKGKAKDTEFKEAVAKLNQENPLAGKKLPFKISGDLPFKVLDVKITQATVKSIKFVIQTQILKDIKKENGEVKQRVTLYFGAFDTNGNLIPGTTNMATNHGWIKLTAGTNYDAQGWWNAKRVQNMENLAYIKIMPKAEYKKL